MHMTSELSMHALENSFSFFQIIHSSVKNRTLFFFFFNVNFVSV